MRYETLKMLRQLAEDDDEGKVSVTYTSGQDLTRIISECLVKLLECQILEIESHLLRS